MNIDRIRKWARESNPSNTAERRKAAFESWRRSIPFTDAEIALALEDEANGIQSEQPGLLIRQERLRFAAENLRSRGRLSYYALTEALPVLVKWCGVCGKKALYRTGSFGRCRAHRYVRLTIQQEREARQGRLNAEHQRTRSESDNRDMAPKRFPANPRRA